MSTVASRTVRSTPHRSVHDTWSFIIDLLTKGVHGDAKKTLESVSGVAASVIADRGPESAAIVVTCDGPRTRIYCQYDDAAIEDDANESVLGHEPLTGDWHVSLPCTAENLAWVQSALQSKTSRISARDAAGDVLGSTAESKKQSLVLDPKGFLGQ